MNSPPASFESRRFRTAAAHYLAGRPAYAPRLIARVAQLCGLGKADRLLDLGCGPGPLARAFAPYVADVVGVDPEPEMLRRARAESPANASWVEGSSRDVGPALGRFRLATMGRSFHWMDRAETLVRLDGILEPEGAVALFRSSTPPDLPENAWRAEYRAVLDRYSKDDESRSPSDRPGWVPHVAVLLESAFSELEEISVIERREDPVEVLVERALSLSSTSRARLGGRADAMVDEVRAVMSRLAPSGRFVEVVATVALIARRP